MAKPEKAIKLNHLTQTWSIYKANAALLSITIIG